MTSAQKGVRYRRAVGVHKVVVEISRSAFCLMCVAVKKESVCCRHLQHSVALEDKVGDKSNSSRKKFKNPFKKSNQWSPAFWLSLDRVQSPSTLTLPRSTQSAYTPRHTVAPADSAHVVMILVQETVDPNNGVR